MFASSLSGICWPEGVPTSRLPICCCILTEFRFHTHDQIEQLLALDDLGCCLAAYSSLNDRLDVGYIDAVTGDLVAIHIDQQAGLAEFANNRQFGKSRHLREPALDFERLALQNIQVGAIDLYGKRALQARQSLVDCIFGRLRVIEDDSGKCLRVASGCPRSALPCYGSRRSSMRHRHKASIPRKTRR